MRQLRSEISEKLDGAPKICIISFWVTIIALISATVGASLLIIGGFEIGRAIALISIPIGSLSIFVGLGGVIYKSYEDREDLKAYRKRYENPRQPWE